MSVLRWLIDGVPLVRNPDTVTKKFDKANVSYVKMADGSQKRIVVPYLISGCDLEMGFTFADERIRNQILPLCNKQLHKLTVAGKLPLRDIYFYADTPEQAMSPDVFGDVRIGQGNIRADLKLACRTDLPYDHSHYPVPKTTSGVNMVAQFGGPSGNNAQDFLPVWNGLDYVRTLSGADRFTFSNLGTAPWSPMIKIIGKFATFSITVAYEDVDGTGSGVVFTYTGTSQVGATDYLLFDTKKLRLYQYVTTVGVLTEIYTFSVVTVANATPFSYWPPLPSGNSDTVVNFTKIVSTDTAPTFDVSNESTETFLYW